MFYEHLKFLIVTFSFVMTIRQSDLRNCLTDFVQTRYGRPESNMVEQF